MKTRLRMPMYKLAIIRLLTVVIVASLNFIACNLFQSGFTAPYFPFILFSTMLLADLIILIKFKEKIPQKYNNFMMKVIICVEILLGGSFFIIGMALLIFGLCSG